MDLRILAKMTGQFRETIFILAILPCGADNVHNEVQGSVLVDCRAWNGMVHISRSFRDSLTALHVGRVGEINGYYYEQYYDNGMVLVPCGVQSLCHRVNVWRNAWLVVCREDQDSGWWWWGEAVGRSVGRSLGILFGIVELSRVVCCLTVDPIWSILFFAHNNNPFVNAPAPQWQWLTLWVAGLLCESMECEL